MTEPEPHMQGPAKAIDPAEPVSGAAEFRLLRAGGTLVALEATPGARPVLLYAGPDIPDAEGAELALLATRQHAPGGPALPIRGSLLNETGTGISGPSGLIAHRSGHDWAIDLRLERAEDINNSGINLHCKDANTGLAVCHELEVDPETGMLRAASKLTNLGSEPLVVDWCAALSLPLDQDLDRLKSFTGRWSGEFQIEEIGRFRGSFVRENKAGRTSHDCFPGLIAGAANTCETLGPAAGFHLAWSGNHRLRVDRHSDGRAIVQMGEMPFPGEIQLASNESYTTPDILACWSQNGFGAISRAFHSHLNRRILSQRVFEKPRPVHYNTWEAVYFNHDLTKLIELADKAADVGAERFVLDDGWFGGRRHDNAGLGDWWVSNDVYPDGLHPLVNHVHRLGMEFGLWFEPEMVNPDSELYRSHPDWVLNAKGVEDVPFRGQHTLDLTKQAVFDYLFEKITALVDEYSIAYIKWDMNRDTYFPGSAGRGAMHQQTLAVYRLMEKLRAAHPKLEIESCSSGGGRADFGILKHSDRIWTSDNNDARQRQDIQRGASWFFPLQVMGSHVGPRRCHVTGRRFSMEYRVATAIFGHMGMELDLRDEKDNDLEVLKAGIALHKQHRDLIHGGQFFRLASPDNTNLIGCVSKTKDEALFSFAVTDIEPKTHPDRIKLGGLDAARRYRVCLSWPHYNPSISTPSIVDHAKLNGDGSVFSGASLMQFGIQPPLTYPDTCLIYHLESEV